MRLPLTLRSNSCVRRASAMPADRNIRGAPTTQNKICRERMFCGKEACGNGPRPWIVYHVDTSAKERRDRLQPIKPNRAAAHNNNGRGTYNNAGVVASDPP